MLLDVIIEVYNVLLFVGLVVTARIFQWRPNDLDAFKGLVFDTAIQRAWGLDNPDAGFTAFYVNIYES